MVTVVVGAVAGLVLTVVLAGAGPAGATSIHGVAGASAAEGAAAPASGGPPGSVPTGASAPGAPPVPPGAVRAATSGPLGHVRSSSVYPGGGLYAYGDADPSSDPLTGLQLNTPLVGMARSANGGEWLVAADGGILTTGGAPFYGSMGDTPLYAPVVGMAATPDGKGYWLVAIDGGIFTFGDAGYYGSMGGKPLAQPVVGMAATPDGKGYWLVAADGGIFTFGDAAFYGSMGGKPLAAPVVGMAATPDGEGYWLVAADGGIFTFGDAAFDGSLGGHALQSGIVAMAATPAGTGYWLLEWSGAVFTFGTAKSYGAPTGTPTAAPFRSIVPTPDGQGYVLLEPDGFNYGFGPPSGPGGFPAIVNAAASQIRPDPDGGYFCNPYGPCEPWCALFATWAWERGGVPIPSYSFVGSIYSWSAADGRVLPPTTEAVAGDDVLYGSGPQDAATAVHVGVVAQVWPDHAVDTIEGDAGPGVTGHLAVVVNGPFLPTDGPAFDNYPVFAIAQP
jgi:hypothetical protein